MCIRDRRLVHSSHTAVRKRPHHFLDLGQLPPQASARMEAGEVRRREAASLADDEGQRVSESHHRRRRRAWRESERASFLNGPQIERNRRAASERALRLAGHSDERRAETLQRRNEAGDFFGFATRGEDKSDVLLVNPPKVPMNSFRRMEKIASRPRGAKRGSNLLPDVSRLPHAADNHCPLRREQQAYRASEVIR